MPWQLVSRQAGLLEGSSARSSWPPAAPRPCPPPGTVWHRLPGSRLLRRTRPAQLCAQACVSGTETTRDPEEAGSACHLGGGLGPCCCRGCREMEAEPAILGLHQNNVIPRWDLGDSGRFHSSVTHSPTNKPPSPWPLCGLPTDRLGDSGKIATSRAHRLPSGPKSSPFFRSLLQPHRQKRPPNFPE